VHGETQLVSHLKVTPQPLRLSDDYKEFGVNCEKMASEIEDHILWGVLRLHLLGGKCGLSSGGDRTEGGGDRTEGGRDKDRGWQGQGQRVTGSAVPVACRGSPDPAQRLMLMLSIPQMLCAPQTPLLRHLPSILGK